MLQHRVLCHGLQLWTSDSGAALQTNWIAVQRSLLLNDNHEFVHGWMRMTAYTDVRPMRKNYATVETNAMKLINKARKQRLGLACKFIQLW